MKRVIVTGSRHWKNRETIEKTLNLVLQKFGKVTLVSGACPTGADRIAEEVWESFGGEVELHPAQWDVHGKAAGPIRNQEMVNLGADFCVAFPLPGSKGTQDCMNRATVAGIPVLVVNEFGELNYE